MDQVEEIKNRVDIVGLIGEQVKLKRAGTSFRGCCPFHKEKTPSFFVHPDRGFYYCFGCQASGDIFTFVQKTEGVEFPEALKILADCAGVKLQKYNAEANTRKSRLMDLLQDTAVYWRELLREPEGKIALQYVNKRGIDAATAEAFKIGYAPDSWDKTMQYLLKKEYTESEIFDSGLTVKKDKSTGYYDRFRDRVIFPIQNIHGRVVGFTARALNDESGAKYINTPESPLYHKGSILYGLDKAKQFIREQDYAIIVEGNMDVIACHGAGFKNVAACSGTALTEEQIKLIKRFSDNVMLSFDQDEAGQNAALRSIDLLLKNEINVKIISLLSGKDPDECLKNSLDDWRESLKKAKPVMQYYFDRFLTDEAMADIHKKKKAVESALAQLAKLQNMIEQDHWLKKLAARVEVDEAILRESFVKNHGGKLNQRSNKQENKTAATEALTGENDKTEKTIKAILAIILTKPELISYAVDYLPAELVPEGALRDFYKSVILYYNDNREITRSELEEKIEQANEVIEKSYLNSLFVFVDKFYCDFTSEEIKKTLVDLIRVYKKEYTTRKISEQMKKMKQAEAAGESEKIKQILEQIAILQNQKDQ